MVLLNRNFMRYLCSCAVIAGTVFQAQRRPFQIRTSDSMHALTDMGNTMTSGDSDVDLRDKGIT